MRQALAAFATAAILVALLVAGIRRGTPTPLPAVETATDSPDPLAGASARLKALLDASAAGDVRSYLDAFDGEARDRLEREVAGRGRDAFAAELRKAAAARKSHALYAPEHDGPDAARIVAESVYPEHNERQTFRLERRGDGWVVTAVEAVRRKVPAARYGTPAIPIAPEAPPFGGTVPPGAGGSEGRKSPQPPEGVPP